jgi:predicted anti-sigma-YlaC factor YlaD
MRCETIGPLLMGYMDGELDGEETARVEAHLQRCARGRGDLAGFRRIDRPTASLKFVVPEDEIWRGYWSRFYNRVERDLGWVLLSVGLTLLVLAGGWIGLRDFFSDPSVPAVLKVGTGLFGAGIVVLFFSILRERIFFRRHQRYRDIRR